MTPFLEEAGWYAHREIDIEYMIRDLKQLGFQTPNQLIADFLREFGNLRIAFKTPDGLYADICINTDVGVQYIDVEDLPILEQLVGEPLLPVGSVQEDLAGLLISFSGKCYMLADGEIYKLGDSFEEACETVYFQRPMMKIFSIEN
ncbi:SUKH-3 domain-containing protein [Fluviicola sp.]|uniref:SUKH-3 domain-containing protein n=1 Tax=Fluviicola sp. TaxID=1917219 RepID=UPI0031D04B03